MSDPFTWAAIIGAAAAVAGATTTYVAAQQQAEVNEYNAKVAQDNAAVAIEEGRVEEERRRRLARIALGEQRAAVGASGLLLEGSPLDLIEDNAAQYEIDALNARREAKLRARGFTVQSGIDRFEAGAARTRGTLGAASELVGGAGSVANVYGQKKIYNARLGTS